jgi:hypothetical protein
MIKALLHRTRNIENHSSKDKMKLKTVAGIYWVAEQKLIFEIKMN